MSKMPIDETDCSAKINALTQQEWQILLDLIPEIENTSQFGEWKGGTRADNSFVAPWCEASPIVGKFLEAVYGIPIIVGFDWMGWAEGRDILSSKDYDFDSLDLVTKCKLITAIVRSDRFSEGELVSAFNSGLILRMLKSIEREVTAKNCK